MTHEFDVGLANLLIALWDRVDGGFIDVHDERDGCATIGTGAKVI